MINNKKVVVVMPAYNAEKTIEQTYAEIPKEFVDEVVLVDDGSRDNTAEVAAKLGIVTIVHEHNGGYGANQKTCYRAAVQRDADIVVMLHPDYQYTPKLITAMISMIAFGVYDCVLGSRIIGNGSLKGGMPLYKYVSNRFLTLVQNMLMRQKLSEYHTGYRAYSKEVLNAIPYWKNSNDFVFDNQFLTQVFFWDFKVGEISCPTKYFPEASSINFSRSVKYGLGCLANALTYALAKAGIYTPLHLKNNPAELGTGFIPTRIHEPA